MKTLAKTIGITLLTVITAFAPLTTAANARDGDGHWRRDNNAQSFPNNERSANHYQGRHNNRWAQQRNAYRHRPDVYRHRNNNDAVALGILGLGAAAIIGGAIANSNNNPRVIYQQPSAPRGVSGGAYEPWSRSWMNYCSNRYRSFNASTGTYRGYDGRDHFCVAN